MATKIKKIKNEFELKKWFERNFKKLGYSKIIKGDSGKFPDFIMSKNNKEVRVELETSSSNFILHNHDRNKVDEVICIKKDVNIGIPILEIKELKYIGGKKKISSTVDKKTVDIIKFLVKERGYRNKSHVIESSIKALAERGEK